jgi:hypothetical protein
VERFLVGIQVTLLGMVTVVVILRRVAGPEEEAGQAQEAEKVLPAEEKPPAVEDGGKRHSPKVIAAITAAVLAACDADARRPRALRLDRGGGRQWKTRGRNKALRN